MKKRAVYAAGACILLAVEILIALFVRDSFVRPYGGDILVTVLLCCLLRAFFLFGIPYLPLGVFLFAAAVEFAQALGIASLIPIAGRRYGSSSAVRFRYGILSAMRSAVSCFGARNG